MGNKHSLSDNRALNSAVNNSNQANTCSQNNLGEINDQNMGDVKESVDSNVCNKPVDMSDIMIEDAEEGSVENQKPNSDVKIDIPDTANTSVQQNNDYKNTTNTVTTTNESKNIIMVLDSSGSMDIHEANVLCTINKFLEENKSNARDNVYFTLILFATEVETKINNVLLSDVKLLEKEDYLPAGNTALYDAIDTAIENHKDAKNVLMAIITDGHENSSKRATRESVAKKIEDMKQQKKWNFLFLANSPDISAEGNNIGVGYCAPTATYSQTNNLSSDNTTFMPMVCRSISEATKCFVETSQVPNLNHIAAQASVTIDNGMLSRNHGKVDTYIPPVASSSVDSRNIINTRHDVNAFAPPMGSLPPVNYPPPLRSPFRSFHDMPEINENRRSTPHPMDHSIIQFNRPANRIFDDSIHKYDYSKTQ